jgi:hypothetical protein
MYNNEWASQILGRPIADDSPLSHSDFLALEAAIAERKAEEARVERERAEYEARLAADPTLPLREKAAELRAAAEERAKLVADARLLAQDKLAGQYPDSFIDGMTDDQAIAVAFNEQADPYTITNDQGHSFVVDPNEAGKPAPAPQTLKERQAAFTAREQAKERAQWGGGDDDA